MKQCIITLAVCSGSLLSAQTRIFEGVFGQNANLTDTVGVAIGTGGKLDDFWTNKNNTNWVQQSNTKTFRYGGIAVETNCRLDGDTVLTNSNLRATIEDYVRKAKYMQNLGSEPLLTLPLRMIAGTDVTSHQQAADACAKLVRWVNRTLISQGRSPVRYWVYSNEPEDGGTDPISSKRIHGYDSVDAAIKIHDYISKMYTSVTGIWDASWGTPKFVGPELYSFDTYAHGTNKVDSLIQQLTGQFSPFNNNSNSGLADIRPYVDVFTWHFYPFNDQSQVTPGIPLPRRTYAVKRLGTGCPVSGGGNSSTLAQDIALVKTWLGSGIEVGITEANICHINDVGAANGGNDLITGEGANSFLAGQFWAEMMCIAMTNDMKYINFWSSIEGCNSCPQSGYKTNVGYLNSNPARFGGVGGKKPTFYHFKMLSDNFRGNMYQGTINFNNQPLDTSFSGKGLKSFVAVQRAGVKIIVMNQNDTAYNYRLNFSANSNDTAGRVTLNFPGVSTDTSFTNQSSWNTGNNFFLSAIPIPRRSTVLLAFDCHGGFLGHKEYTEKMARDSTAPQFKQIGTVILDPSVISCELGGSIGGSLSSNTAFAFDTVVVNTDLTLDDYVSLSFTNCLVVMGPGARIIGNTGNKITVKNSVILGCDQSNWGGIEMGGNNVRYEESLVIEDSYLINAQHPVKTDKIPDVTILRNVFVNGEKAIDMEDGERFKINQNLIGCYNTAIKTYNFAGSATGHQCEINTNKIVDVDYGISTNSDTHDSLDVLCNEFRFNNIGILNSGCTFKDFGTASNSAGNRFVNNTSEEPADFLQHSGNNPTYYYESSQYAQFTYPVMDITTTQASNERMCATVFSNDCPQWQPLVSLKEHTKDLFKRFIVYPNPSGGEFSFKFDGGEKSYVLIVVDMLGRQVLTKSGSFQNSSNLKFALRERGIYMAALDTEGKRYAQKIIVQ
jgi:hypothetical protein